MKKSALASRSEEGLEDQVGVSFRRISEPIEVFENGIKFHVYLKDSQKTGFYLDQREMRALCGQYIQRQKGLELFFPIPAVFTVYALAGGAKACVSVDNSRSALQAAKENIMLKQSSGYRA
jgi:23S rRNA (cytosine1962-C5)-methyltransferase